VKADSLLDLYGVPGSAGILACVGVAEKEAGKDACAPRDEKTDLGRLDETVSSSTYSECSL
jgi:hypothetical protein